MAMAQLFFYTFLILGTFQFPRLSLSLSDSDPQELEFTDSYLGRYPTKFTQQDPMTGQLIFYEIVSADDQVPRVKRETISGQAEEDKSAFSKKSTTLPVKKPMNVPIGVTIKLDIVKNVSMPTTPQSATENMNKTETPDNGSPTLSSSVTSTSTSQSPSNININNSTFKVTTLKPVVVDIVPTQSSPPMNSFPGPKVKPSNSTTIITNSTTTSNTPNTTLSLPDLYPLFPEFPPDLPKNYTTKNDTHRYYNSSYFQQGEFLWVDLGNHPDAETHELLSNAHRRAATVKLEFEFPFYGHLVTNVTMATGGFIYLGEQVHAWLAATQYVAPLMANFDSRVDNTSSVRFLSNATQFTVEWDQVHLHNSTDDRPFTFQTSLYKNGTIVFAYKEIPADVKELNDTHHPVKVGLSDAYITDKTILFVKSRTIFEYDRVDLKDYKITNGSGIIFTALPTCLSYKTCQDCTTQESQFNCVWCPLAKRCSDGTDRHRQDWLIKRCAFHSLDTHVSCFIGTTSTESSDTYRNFGHDDHDDHDDHDHIDDKHLISPVDEQYNHDHHQTVYAPEKVTHEENSSGMSASGVFGLLFFLSILMGMGGWVLYAYYHPHTPSGQLLIRFRPSQWGAFRRGEARYTAASIHM